MEIKSGDIVRSVAGRDKDLLLYVLKAEDGFAYTVDGLVRKVGNPKKKKLKHLEFFSDAQSRVREKILNGDAITDAEVRKALKIQSCVENDN